jgi:DNA anti-recombination protein RmuC
VLSCIIAFFAINFAIVKYVNRDLEREFDTIKNNHIAHMNKDIQELKEGQKETNEKMDNEFKEIRKETNDRFNKIDSDISYIKGMLEILVKDKVVDLKK